MKAKQLLAGRILAADQRRIIYDAFDAAWEIVRPLTRSCDAEQARLQLAEIVLGMDQRLDTVELRDRAVQRYVTEVLTLKGSLQ